MASEPASRETVRNLMTESDVVPTDQLTAALAGLSHFGQRPAPEMSPAVAEAISRASAPVGPSSTTGVNAGDTVILLRTGEAGNGKRSNGPEGRGRAGRRGAAVSGAVVLAMAAGIGGVAAFGPDNAVETAIETVIRWAAPVEQPEPESGERPDPVQPAVVPPGEAPSSGEVPPAPAPMPTQPESSEPEEAASPEASPEPSREHPVPASPKGRPENPGEQARRNVPPVELPELPLPALESTPPSGPPVDPPGLSDPERTPKPVPSAKPSR